MELEEQKWSSVHLSEPCARTGNRTGCSGHPRSVCSSLSQAGSRARKVRGLPTGDREAGELLRGRGAGPRKRGRFWTEQVGLSGDLDGTTEVAGGRDPGPGYRKREKGTQGRPSPFSQMQTMWQELWQAAAAVN